MTRVLTWPEIESALEGVDLVAAMEEAFVAYSEGRAVVPPVGELILEEPRGACGSGSVSKREPYSGQFPPGRVPAGMPRWNGRMMREAI